jgi:hypothetical protein
LRTGWTWDELKATPEHVVNDVKTYLRKEDLIAKEKKQLAEAKARRNAHR